MEISTRLLVIHVPYPLEIYIEMFSISTFFCMKNSFCSSKDAATDLNYVIPIRLYGDGAEAQRNLV